MHYVMLHIMLPSVNVFMVILETQRFNAVSIRQIFYSRTYLQNEIGLKAFLKLFTQDIDLFF